MFVAIMGLGLLTVMQVAVVLLMYYGNARPAWRRASYLFAAFLGFVSAADMVIIFDHMNANLATGIATGAPFVFGQLFLARVTQSRLSPGHWSGVGCVTVGLFLLAYYTRS